MDKKPISHADIVSLLDDVVEFNDYCAFLCDAMASLFAEYAENDAESHTIQGVRRHCSDLKERAEKLEEVLNNLYQQSYTGSQITSLKPGKK